MIQSAPLMLTSYSERPTLYLQLASGELMICLEILFAGSASDLRGERRRRRLLVPANLLQIITHILLVIRFLRLARGVMIGRPEARRVRGKYFVSQRYTRRRTA